MMLVGQRKTHAFCMQATGLNRQSAARSELRHGKERVKNVAWIEYVCGTDERDKWQKASVLVLVVVLVAATSTSRFSISVGRCQAQEVKLLLLAFCSSN